jgi:hypothetical protein
MVKTNIGNERREQYRMMGEDTRRMRRIRNEMKT